MPDSRLGRVLAWLDTRPRGARMALAAACGAAAALGQAPWNFVWIAVPALTLMALLVGGPPRRRVRMQAGWAAGAGYFALSLLWIIEPFLVDVARHGWMAPFALAFMAGGLALFWGLAAAPASGALAWAVALTAAEFLRAHAFGGFPWALVGYAWTGGGMVQWASVVGIHGLTLVTLLAAAGIAAALRARPALALLPVLALVAADLAGAARIPEAAPAADRPVVRLVQPNAAQRLKWDPAWAEAFHALALALTAETAETAPALVVWPETAVPWLLEDAGPTLAEISEAAGGVPVALGIQRREGTRYFNSLVTIDATGEVTQVYDKHHLVPFGEYLPGDWLLAHVGLGAFAARNGGGFTPGPGARLIDLGPLGAALPLICYEAIFPQDVAAAPARPALLLQVTNDGWFGTLSGPYQHLAQAMVRAIEQGVPLARAANTGVSAMVDPWGRITDSLPLGTAGRIDAVLPAPRPPTPYAIAGDWPFLAAMAILALVAALRVLRKAD